MLWRRELLFIQNYKPGLWRHTWSLAIEEHFYIVLPIFLLLLVRFSRNRRDPFKLVAFAFCGLALGCLLMRYVAVYLRTYNPEEFWIVMFSTHLRIDALFCGVVVSYYYHFRPELIRNLLATFRNRLVLEAATALFIGICFVVPVESPFMQSIGLTFVYIGFAGLLLIVMSAREREPNRSGINAVWTRLSKGLAYVGVYSYSIYLWHVPISVYGLRLVTRVSPVQLSPASLTYIYALMSIIVGIVMAKLVELPMLKVRDKLFPRSSNFVIANTTLVEETVRHSAPSPSLVHLN
jgi:peptidoglycan/LPS O-acetylase OafA/YrhL